MVFSKYLIIEDYNKENNRRRSFFERFAKHRQFDPRIPENWYLLSKDDYATSKVRIEIIRQNKVTYIFIYVLCRA